MDVAPSAPALPSALISTSASALPPLTSPPPTVTSPENYVAKCFVLIASHR